MNIDQLLKDPPLLHDSGGGGLTSWALGEEALRFIEAHAGSQDCTLETGAGVSTLVFAMTGARHTCVTPAQQEVDRIEAYCAAHGISLANIDFIVEASQLALPGLSTRALDLVLIDGSHAFPLPFLDWFYAERYLRVDGVMMIDDVHLWPPKALVEFLRLEPAWEFLRSLSGRTAVFRKVRDTEVKDWGAQRYVVAHSDMSVIAEFGDVGSFAGVDGGRLVIDLIRKRKWLVLRKVVSAWRRSRSNRPDSGTR